MERYFPLCINHESFPFIQECGKNRTETQKSARKDGIPIRSTVHFDARKVKNNRGFSIHIHTAIISLDNPWSRLDFSPPHYNEVTCRPLVRRLQKRRISMHSEFMIER